MPSNPAKSLRNPMRLVLACGACVLLLAAPATAQPADDSSAGPITQRMRHAYEQVRTYDASIRYVQTHSQGRWAQKRAAEMRVAFDRSNGRLRVEHPGYTLVVNDGTLRAQRRGNTRTYLQTEAPDTLTYGWLEQSSPAVASPLVPDLAMLLADDPLTLLSDRWLRDVREQRANGSAGPTVTLTSDRSETRLTLDPDTHLVKEMVSELSAEAVGLGEDESITRRYTITINTFNEPIDADVFTLDTRNARPVDAAKAMGGADRPDYPRVGDPIPDVTFHDIDGQLVKPAQLESKVIVLDFWATWCMPCRPWMDQLANIQQWAQRNNKDVAIYAVSMDEDLAKARRYWGEKGYPFGYLEARDPDATRRGYGVSQGQRSTRSIALPTTILLHEGRIEAGHRGVGPGSRKKLQGQIDRLLSDGAEGR